MNWGSKRSKVRQCGLLSFLVRLGRNYHEIEVGEKKEAGGGGDLARTCVRLSTGSAETQTAIIGEAPSLLTSFALTYNLQSDSDTGPPPPILRPHLHPHPSDMIFRHLRSSPFFAPH